VPANVERHMDTLEYPVLKGFTGQERIESVSIDPSKITGLAADSLGNYWLNAGTILCNVPGSHLHTCIGEWVTGETASESNAPNVGNNGTGTVTAQNQLVVVKGTSGKWGLIDWQGNETFEKLEFNAKKAELEKALSTLPGAQTYEVKEVKAKEFEIVSIGAGLGLNRTFTGVKGTLAGETPGVAVTQKAEGQYITGILGINVRFFGTEAADVEAAPMLVHNCAFDTSRIQNYATYKYALLNSPNLRNCRFE
jgi:hypothetical protein